VRLVPTPYGTVVIRGKKKRFHPGLVVVRKKGRLYGGMLKKRTLSHSRRR